MLLFSLEGRRPGGGQIRDMRGETGGRGGWSRRSEEWREPGESRERLWETGGGGGGQYFHPHPHLRDGGRQDSSRPAKHWRGRSYGRGRYRLAPR